MLYLKAVHILFVISWMAGIFYLPRIFVHYVEGLSAGEDVRRLKVMARKLYGFTTLMMVPAVVTGVALWMLQWQGATWPGAKVFFVALLAGYHHSMGVYLKRQQNDEPLPRSVTLRWYNELPLLILLPILYLVVFKPF